MTCSDGCSWLVTCGLLRAFCGYVLLLFPGYGFILSSFCNSLTTRQKPLLGTRLYLTVSALTASGTRQTGMAIHGEDRIIPAHPGANNKG